MTKSILKKVLSIIIFCCALSINAQVGKPSKTANFIYYVDLKNVNTKTLCLEIENKIAKQTGVISFKTVGFPSKYFILKSNTPVNREQLNVWLQNTNAQIIYYGPSNGSLEDLFENQKKVKK